MKLIVRSIFSILFVALLAVVALALLPGRRIAEVAEHQFESATGRTLGIGGKISPSLFPVLGVRMGNVSVSNADWAGESPMFEADGLSVGVRLGPLLSGRIEIDEVSFDAPVFRLTVSESGRANWNLATKDQDDGPSGQGVPPVSISAVRVRNAAVIYDDRSAGLTYRLEDVDSDLELSSDKGTLRLAGTLNGLPVAVKSQVGNLAGLLNGDVGKFTLNGKIDNSIYAVDGSLDLEPLAVRASTLIEGGDAGSIAQALAGVSLTMPKGLLSNPKFSGAVTYAEDGVLYLRNGYLRSGPNEVTLEADFRHGGTGPRLSARLSSGRLDLSDLAAEAQPSAVEPAAAGWPKDQIDVSALGLLDAEVRLDLAGLLLGEIEVGRLDTTINLDRSRLVSRIHELNLYGGRIDGQAVVNGRNGLSLGGDLRSSGLALQPLLTDLADLDRLIAPIDLQVKYLAVGNTVHALMQSLSGEGRFHVGKGEIVGIDLPKLRSSLGFRQEKAGERTIVERVAGTFSIDAGVLRNSDMAFASPVVDGTGSGTVDLGRQYVDYRLMPVLTKRAGELTVPLDITGPWSDITIRPNVASLVGQNLDVPLHLVGDGAKEVLKVTEDTVKADALTKIGGELDSTVETTADIEDAVQDKAVRELERGLKRLFD